MTWPNGVQIPDDEVAIAANHVVVFDAGFIDGRRMCECVTCVRHRMPASFVPDARSQPTTTSFDSEKSKPEDRSARRSSDPALTCDEFQRRPSLTQKEERYSVGGENGIRRFIP